MGINTHLGGHGSVLETNAIASALEAGRQISAVSQEPKKAGIQDAKPYVILRDEKGAEIVHYVDERFDSVPRKTGTVSVKDAASFIAYFKKHAANGQFIYATLDPAKFIAVLNDHTEKDAGFRDHRAQFTVGFSREYETWTGMHNKPFEGNEAFAYFIEGCLPDFVKPAGADMLAMALNFKVNQQVKFGNLARLQDGNTELTYHNIVDASPTSERGGKIKIPETFTLEIPIFDGIDAPKYKIEARFRFRLYSGALTLKYELVRPHKAVEQAFKDLWKQIEKETKATILHGTP